MARQVCSRHYALSLFPTLRSLRMIFNRRCRPGRNEPALSRLWRKRFLVVRVAFICSWGSESYGTSVRSCLPNGRWVNSGGCTLRAPPPEHGCYALGMQRCDVWSVSGQRLCTCYREGLARTAALFAVARHYALALCNHRRAGV